MPAKVVIATTTFSKTPDLRAKLALRTVEEAVTYGYEIVVIDGGSYPEFRAELLAKGARVFTQEAPGMGNSRRQAMRLAGELAQEDGVIVWMEPEKHTLVSWINSFTKPIVTGQADMVVPSRHNLFSYPPEQMDAELLGNQALKYLIGRDLDFWFGPTAFNQKVLPYFLNYKDTRWGDTWDSIHVPRLQVLKDGLRVMTSMVVYFHPSEQTKEESGNLAMLMKRIAQLQNLIPALWTVAYELGFTDQQPPQ